MIAVCVVFMRFCDRVPCAKDGLGVFYRKLDHFLFSLWYYMA
jgi:hypothetical protein